MDNYFHGLEQPTMHGPGQSKPSQLAAQKHLSSMKTAMTLRALAHEITMKPNDQDNCNRSSKHAKLTRQTNLCMHTLVGRHTDTNKEKFRGTHREGYLVRGNPTSQTSQVYGNPDRHE